MRISTLQYKQQKDMSLEENMDKGFVIYLGNQSIVLLPTSLKAIYDSIEKSKYILDLPDNWDEESAESYSPNTWVRAISFLANYANFFLKEYDKIVSAPKIFHDPDGSIDIHWKRENYMLLLNIPKDDSDVTFYGETKNGKGVEGMIELKENDFYLMPNLLLQ